jgi:uncharacterized protein
VTLKHQPVYLDTGPLYALADRRDQGHSRALQLFTRLKEVRARLMCPTSTLLELHSLTLYKGLRNAHVVASVAFRSYIAVYPQAFDIEAGLEIVARFSDQGVTLNDAVLASMCRREGAKVLTFDHRHFRLMGAEIYE